MEKQEEQNERMGELAVSRIPWYRKISVEPPMFCYMMAYMLTSVVEQAFYVHKACTVNHNYTAEICDNIELHQDVKKEVQLTVSNFQQWNNIAGHIVPIILALFLGAWSDRRGRKIPLILGLSGKLYYSLMVIVNSTQTTWPLQYVIYTATIPSAFTGADVAIFASCFAYISDITSVKDRTIRITILDACYLSTMPTGVALGSYLYSYVVGKSFTSMFIINSSLLLLGIVYSILFLQWRTTERQESMRHLSIWGILKDFFDRKHVYESVKTLTKKRTANRRIYLWIFLISMFFYTFQRDEKPMLYLYTQYNFNWNTETYSYFKTFQSTAYVILMLTVIPLMSKVFGWMDTTIIMIGAGAHAIARLFFGLATTPWLFYVGGAVSSLGPIVAPVLRSMTSKLVPGIERGKVFALLSVCDNAVPLFSGVLYTQVYNVAIGHANIFWLTLSTQVVVLLLTLGIHIKLNGEGLKDPDIEKTDSLIENPNGSASQITNQEVKN